MQTHVPDLLGWITQHPEVQEDANCSIGPRQIVDVETLPLTFLVPTVPVKRNRVALEYCSKVEGNESGDVCVDCDPQQ